MYKIKDVLKSLLEENSNKTILYRRNVLKEYLQIFVLDFIYSNKKYKDLIFYGGSCLSQCYGLPRLSEDLDFVDIKKKINLKEMALALENYFKNKTDLRPIAKIQKFRIYLKFHILEELELADKSESDMLLLKIEIFKGFDFCKKYKTEIKPLFKLNKSLLVKVFDLPTLMSTKIRAVLNRKWEKTDKQGRTLLAVKGRDYFDLMWYIEKGVRPNIECLDKAKNLDEVKKNLINIINKVDAKSIKLDLENFISDTDFVKDLSGNIKNILISGVEKME
ncbi:nucleotidyl transferase AbiEii/AbiGii toxin family protein [Candidatus Parcubacteria bacterium]|nr:nucleotidyl transferase AbiEii/AbiGii toxin family protein [Candidatus Parcubacteria bacterium]